MNKLKNIDHGNYEIDSFRYIDNEHSVVQLLVGGILGILFGCGFYNMSIMQ